MTHGRRTPQARPPVTPRCVPRSLRARALLTTVALVLVACGDTSPTPFDYCADAPPDDACYAAKRDPVSDNVALALEIADAQIARQAAADVPWDWGESVMMLGFVELYRVTQEPRLLAYMQGWIDHHIEEGYELNVNDECPPALTAMFLYEETGEERYRAVVLDVLDFLANDALRTDEGGINHLGLVGAFGVSIWLDSLFMFGTVVTRWSDVTGEEEHLELYAEQVRIFFDILEEQPGLLRHADDGWLAEQDPDVYWARGNAWVTVANAEYLRVRTERGEGDSFVRSALRRQFDAMIDTQNPDTGRWWTIVNRPDEIYEETSATALFAYAMARAWRYGLVGDEVLAPMRAAVDGVLEKIVRAGDGTPEVTDISGPTTAGPIANYEVSLGSDISYGLGATLLMLVETSGLDESVTE